MEYKLTQHGDARTIDYRGTVNYLDDETLLLIKQNVKIHNEHVRETSRRYKRIIGQLQRVRIMGRGPRAIHAASEYGYRRAYDSYIPLHLAETYDIYVGHDGTAEYDLRREFETGLRPGELRKIEKLRHEIMMIETDGWRRKRKWANA